LYGNIYDEKVKEALEAVENKTNFYKFLGNYRQGN
jgi:prephenate dehydratase